EAGHFNLTIRTLGLQLLLLAFIHLFWAEGQPFAFPGLFSSSAAIRFGDTAISWMTIGTVGAATLLTGAFVCLFNFTDLGLQIVAVAERPNIARLLGIETRRLILISWILVSVVATIVGVLLAPLALLSSEMMEPYMLLAFTAVVVGGLTSLYGVFVGGII